MPGDVRQARPQRHRAARLRRTFCYSTGHEVAGAYARPFTCRCACTIDRRQACKDGNPLTPLCPARVGGGHHAWEPSSLLRGLGYRTLGAAGIRQARSSSPTTSISSPRPSSSLSNPRQDPGAIPQYGGLIAQRPMSVTRNLSGACPVFPVRPSQGRQRLTSSSSRALGPLDARRGPNRRALAPTWPIWHWRNRHGGLPADTRMLFPAHDLRSRNTGCHRCRPGGGPLRGKTSARVM